MEIQDFKLYGELPLELRESIVKIICEEKSRQEGIPLRLTCKEWHKFINRIYLPISAQYLNFDLGKHFFMTLFKDEVVLFKPHEWEDKRILKTVVVIIDGITLKQRQIILEGNYYNGYTYTYSVPGYKDYVEEYSNFITPCEQGFYMNQINDFSLLLYNGKNVEFVPCSIKIEGALGSIACTKESFVLDYFGPNGVVGKAGLLFYDLTKEEKINIDLEEANLTYPRNFGDVFIMQKNGLNSAFYLIDPKLKNPIIKKIYLPYPEKDCYIRTVFTDYQSDSLISAVEVTEEKGDYNDSRYFYFYITDISNEETKIKEFTVEDFHFSKTDENDAYRDEKHKYMSVGLCLNNKYLFSVLSEDFSFRSTYNKCSFGLFIIYDLWKEEMVYKRDLYCHFEKNIDRNNIMLLVGDNIFIPICTEKHFHAKSNGDFAVDYSPSCEWLPTNYQLLTINVKSFLQHRKL